MTKRINRTHLKRMYGGHAVHHTLDMKGGDTFNMRPSYRSQYISVPSSFWTHVVPEGCI